MFVAQCSILKLGYGSKISTNSTLNSFRFRVLQPNAILRLYNFSFNLSSLINPNAIPLISYNLTKNSKCLEKNLTAY